MNPFTHFGAVTRQTNSGTTTDDDPPMQCPQGGHRDPVTGQCPPIQEHNPNPVITTYTPPIIINTTKNTTASVTDWIKANPLLAGGLVVGAVLLFKGKK